MHRTLPLMSSAWKVKPRVLILGIYLADRANTVSHLVQRFDESRQCEVTQIWVALNGAPPNASVANVTVKQTSGYIPKFVLLNKLLETIDWRSYDYIVFTDDDIIVPHYFLDRYLSCQNEFDFALAQPARTRNSYADHKFCKQRKDIRGRQTLFVEIGPLFSVRRDIAPIILPFDETSGMGWGFDFVWPVLVNANNKNIGIVDNTPVDHSLRDQTSAYSSEKARQVMDNYLKDLPHLSKLDACKVLREFL
jgi:hypothetical protein